MEPRALLVFDDLFLEHDPGPGHVECAARLAAIRRALRRLPEGAAFAPARDASGEELSRVHSPRYLAGLEALRGTSAQLDPDTAVSPRSIAAAVRAAGACCGLVDALLERRAEAGFALVRPPGHHAERSEAMGFCLLNNAAIAAEHARARGVERVAVVDWDVHHGNGTQHHFERRRDVLFASSHRFPFYPGTGDAQEVGVAEGLGFTLNVPLPEGMGDGDLGAAWSGLIAPAVEQFRPGLIVVSAGFDAHRDDPLGGMAMTSAGFAGLCALMREVGRRSGAPLLLTLEGGYALEALAESVQACVEVLAGAGAPLSTAASSAGRRAREEAREVQGQFWKV
jgi:acetoin utilization deacetylase AcuC-like enzyme